MQLRFLIKSTFIAGLFLFASLLIIQYTNRFLNKRHDDDALYIWGDSQTYQGIDLKLLKQKLNCNVYSAAKHGAGVYDFLVFAENVPENSKVLIGLSKAVIVRRKKFDYNNSGLEINALHELFSNSYTIKDIIDISLKNYNFNKQLFKTRNTLYENSDSIKLTQSLDLITESFNKKPKYFNDKIQLYIEGFKILENKNCKINMINFSNSSIIEKIISKTEVSILCDNFFDLLSKKFKTKMYNFKITENANVFYDFTHVNSNGALVITKKISEFIGNKGFFIRLTN